MGKAFKLHLLFFVASAFSVATPPAVAQPLPVEPVALPRAVEQGVDIVYIDPEITVDIRWRNTKLDNVSFARYAGAPLDLVVRVTVGEATGELPPARLLA